MEKLSRSASGTHLEPRIQTDADNQMACLFMNAYENAWKQKIVGKYSIRSVQAFDSPQAKQDGKRFNGLYDCRAGRYDFDGLIQSVET
jgi:hypothetical protein